MNSQIIFEAVRKCTFRVVLIRQRYRFCDFEARDVVAVQCAECEVLTTQKAMSCEVSRKLFVHSQNYSIGCRKFDKGRTSMPKH